MFNRLILSFSLFICSLSLAQSENLTVVEDSLISRLMSAKKKFDKDTYESKFFTIQLYYGNFKEAEEIFEKFKENFPEWKAELSFETPNYKVQVGNYKDYYFGISKLKEIKSTYPSAFLLEIKN